LSYERPTVRSAAKELGIGENLLYRWRSEQKELGSASFSGNGNKRLTEEQKEVEALKKQLKDKDLELEILKKAIGIFSKRDGINTRS